MKSKCLPFVLIHRQIQIIGWTSHNFTQHQGNDSVEDYKFDASHFWIQQLLKTDW